MKENSPTLNHKKETSNTSGKDHTVALEGLLSTQTEALKQITVLLYKSFSHEKEIKVLNDEIVFLREKLKALQDNSDYDKKMESLLDEIIFLRKKLDSGKEIEQKYNNLLSRVERLEKGRAIVISDEHEFKQSCKHLKTLGVNILNPLKEC